MPFRIQVRFVRKDKDEVMEDSIYLGEIPIMIGGGEFIINGAERVIVNQLHRSPGVDFLVEVQEGDRPLHGCRVIPERGSWIECSVTKKDALAVRIDQSSKIPATTFLRALDKKYSTTEAIIKEFYTIENGEGRPSFSRRYYAADADHRRRERRRAGQGRRADRRGAATRSRPRASRASTCVTKVTDPLILNTLAEDTAESHENALLKIYARLRPGNPPQLDKAETLFEEKFFDENRYRLGRVGRFRINRKFDQNVPETVMTLRSEDLVNSLKYMFKLRSGEGYVDDIDHLGNRRLRTIDELAGEELRKGFLKLKRTVQERMSLKDPNELGRIAELVNSKSHQQQHRFLLRPRRAFAGRRSDQPAVAAHARAASVGPWARRFEPQARGLRSARRAHLALRPNLSDRNAGRHEHRSDRVAVDLRRPRRIRLPHHALPRGEGRQGQRRAQVSPRRRRDEGDPRSAGCGGEGRPSEEGHRCWPACRAIWRPCRSKEVQYIDISPRQTVSVSAALIPFLEHDDANRALMGSNMQRQAVPLLRTDPPVVATGMERPVAQNSGMVVRAERAGVVTYVDAMRILIDNADEYVLRKFVGLNERTCLNQKPIVKKGQRVKKGQILADGAATHQGELALGRNVLVAFMTYDGYNFEDAIVISQRLVKEDTFTSIHIEEYDVEIRETKLGREEFTRDIPNVSERALANLDENGVVRVGTRVGPGDILVGKIAPKSKSELTPEEKLLHAIFGRAGEDVKNDSLEMPAGEEGVVIGAQRFSRRMHMTRRAEEGAEEGHRQIRKGHEPPRHRDLQADGRRRSTKSPASRWSTRAPARRSARAKTPTSSWNRSRPSSEEWIKGSKESKEQAVNTYSPLLAARAGGAEGKSPPHGAHEARRRAAVGRAGNGEGLRRHQAAAVASATRWPAVTATRASSPASCRKRTCRSSKTARRSTSCSIRWACPAV